MSFWHNYNLNKGQSRTENDHCLCYPFSYLYFKPLTYITEDEIHLNFWVYINFVFHFTGAF